MKPQEALKIIDETVIRNLELKIVVSNALEKQIPRKVEIYDDDCRADCPVCGCEFENNINDWGCKYCQRCGQALDWGDCE